MPKAVYVNLGRCIACHACEVACGRIHRGSSYIIVEVVDDSASLPLLCRQCEKATCVSVCYTSALAVCDDGVVNVNASSCTGCGLCVFACPFGVLSLGDMVVEKCDLCRERGMPVCVVTCPANALTFGEHNLFTESVRRKAGLDMLRAMPSSIEGRPKK